MRELCCAVLILAAAPAWTHGQPAAAGERAEVEAFNRAFDEATRHMDNAASLALWEDDGTSLLPSTKPIVGKKAIASFLDQVVATLPGAHMEKFEDACFDIQVSGNWASEWCVEHQIVQFPAGKPPFEGWGKMLLVLHKGADGKWHLKQEMWNQALPPEPSAHPRPGQQSN
jgi:ketosteroid isomerase-like protein